MKNGSRFDVIKGNDTGLVFSRATFTSAVRFLKSYGLYNSETIWFDFSSAKRTRDLKMVSLTPDELIFNQSLPEDVRRYIYELEKEKLEKELAKEKLKLSLETDLEREKSKLVTETLKSFEITTSLNNYLASAFALSPRVVIGAYSFVSLKSLLYLILNNCIKSSSVMTPCDDMCGFICFSKITSIPNSQCLHPFSALINRPRGDLSDAGQVQENEPEPRK